MFWSATAFNQPIGSWDVSSVTGMTVMFDSATAFNQPIGTWNTSKVTEMIQMFDSASAFNQPLNSWDVSKVTHMESMFTNASAFNQDISLWNVSKVTNMNDMFRSASVFNQDIHAWCVPLIASKPASFDVGSNVGFAGQAAKQPSWGTCNKTVTFDGNGGTGHTPTTKLVASGAALGALPSNPAQAGYSFNGWFTAITGGSAVTAATVITGNITFYAQWTAVVNGVCGTAN